MRSSSLLTACLLAATTATISVVATAHPGRDGAGRAPSGSAEAHHGRRGGPEHATPWMSPRVLHALGLSDAQTQRIDAEREALKKAHEPVRAHARALTEAVALGVERGAFDDEAIAREQKAIAEAARAGTPALQHSAEVVHDVLTPAQRKALVAELRAHGRRFSEGEHGGGHAGVRPEPHGPAELLSRELGLSPAQEQALRAALPSPPERTPGAHVAKMVERRGRLQALASAFESERFDAGALHLGEPIAETAREHLDRMIGFARASAKVLTDAQRVRFAELIRERFEHEEAR